MKTAKPKICLCICRACMTGWHCEGDQCSRKRGDSLKSRDIGVEYDEEREREQDRDYGMDGW
jgi:hypothetical protein